MRPEELNVINVIRQLAVLYIGRSQQTGGRMGVSFFHFFPFYNLG